jgi:hypothetical protein
MTARLAVLRQCAGQLAFDLRRYPVRERQLLGESKLAFDLRRYPVRERQFGVGAGGPAGGSQGGGAGGQTTVELALVFPVVLLLILVLIQAALVLRDDLALTSAAREAARAASLDADPARAERAAAAVLPGARVSSGARPAVGELVIVRVSYRSPTTLPLVGPLLPDPELVAHAAMRVER